MVRPLCLAFLIVIGVVSVIPAQAQTTIYWKKDYIRDASGAAIAVATPAPADTAAPDAPASLSVTGTTTTSVSLTWSSTSDEMGGSGLAGYVIYRGPVPVGGVGSGTTSFDDLGLIANTSYSYRVVAFDVARNYSAYSTAAVANTDAASGSPTALTAAATSTTQVNLNWTAPATAPHHYGIWRRSGTGSYTKVDTASSTSYSDSGLTANTAYLFKVSAEDASNVVSGWSNADLATTLLFTDDTITTGVTEMKAAHVTELRTAVRRECN